MSPIITQAKILVADRHAKNIISIPIIAIAGSPAVGKTYFARLLSNLLSAEHFKVKILTQDDFLEKTRMHAYIIHPFLNYLKLHSVLKQIKNNEGPFADADIVIFEGVYSICGPESFDFFKYCSLSIFMEGNEKDVCAWHWEREKAKPNDKRRSKKRFQKELKCNMIDYHSNILPCKKNADFIIFKKNKYNYRLC